MTSTLPCVMMHQVKIRLLSHHVHGLCVSSASRLAWRHFDFSNKCRSVHVVRFYSRSLHCGHSLQDDKRTLNTQIKGLTQVHQRRCYSYQSWAQSWALWMSHSTPVVTTQTYLHSVHETIHLPWWLTIVLTTVGLRFLVTLPLSVYAQAIMARLRNLQPEFKTLAAELHKETVTAAKMYEWSPKFAKKMFQISLKKRCSELIVRENCHPFKTTVVAWVQIPMWISLSFAYRNLTTMMPTPDLAAQVIFLELSAGGILWFPNLTVPDASLILPISLGLINLAITEIHALRTLKSTRFQSVVTNLLRVMSVLMIPIAASVPSCLALYWTTSSAAGLVQNILLLYPSVRRLCRIPFTPGESLHPFQEINTNLKTKASNLKMRLKL